MKLEFESNIAEAPSFADKYTDDPVSTNEEDISRMLQAGVKAAQNGNRAEARDLLLQVTEAAPNNENAWLWLASISEYPEELLVFLNNVLNINPNNARALEWAHATKSLLAKNFVQRGVDASNEARMDLAKQCFLQAVVHDERNEMAWFWLASISDSADEKLSHLQKVLNINPENQTALTALQVAKIQVSESLLRRANTAAIAGERETAGEMLQKILKQTPELEEAWILKSYLADSFSDKVSCYERVLSINPENDAAISGLASLREMMERTANRKSQNLAVVAAFMANAPVEAQIETETDSILTETDLISVEPDSGNLMEFVEVSEVVEDAHLVPEENEPEVQLTQEMHFAPTSEEVAPAETETEDNFYSFQEEIREESAENYYAPPASEPNEYQAAENEYQAAERVTELGDYGQADAELESKAVPVAEAENDDETEFAPQIFTDYSDQETYTAPTDDLKFSAENALEADYSFSSNIEVEAPFQDSMPAVKRVMVIDDSAMVRKLIAQKLETSGYEVICAAGGIEALETIKQIVPDLILLDTAMPQMDGYQVCQAIRGNDATKDVPVVMISGKDGFFDKVRGQMSGSTGYIAKPFGPETLMKTVESYIVQ